MNESFDELQELAGEYVLGTLHPARRQEVERRLPVDPVLRSAVDAWEQRLLPLTSLVEEQQPSPQLWPRILKDLRSGSMAVPAGWRNWWNDLRFWRVLAAGGFVAATAFALMISMRPPVPSSAPAFMVVLVEPQDRTPGWIVQTGLDRQLTLTPLRPINVPSQNALQFWTKADGWAGPVSLGLVEPGKPVKLALDKLPPMQPNQLFEITLEPKTGSPTGKPSGPILYIGKAVKMT